jgi:hypothetical protein
MLYQYPSWIIGCVIQRLEEKVHEKSKKTTKRGLEEKFNLQEHM